MKQKPEGIKEILSYFKNKLEKIGWEGIYNYAELCKNPRNKHLLENLCREREYRFLCHRYYEYEIRDVIKRIPNYAKPTNEEFCKYINNCGIPDNFGFYYNDNLKGVYENGKY
jgi:hypothetical protein